MNLEDLIRDKGYHGADAELTALRARVSALQTALAEAERQAAHNKHDHANEVKRAKILKEKGDLPLERVRAYGLMGELQGQVERLTAQLQLAAAVNEGRGENDKKLNKVTDALIEQLRAEVFTSYEKGAESMRERAARVAEDYQLMYLGKRETGLSLRQWLAGHIRALPLKENEG